MTTVNGLPAHILLVHAIVVLLPLTALLLVLTTVWPPARARLAGPNAILAVAVVVLIPITTNAGEWLERRVAPTPLLRDHTELGDTAIWYAIPLAALALIVWWRQREAAIVPAEHDHAAQLRTMVAAAVAHHPAGGVATAVERRTYLAPGSAIATRVITTLAVVVAVAALIGIYRIGDSGLRAAWTGQVATTPAEPNPGAPRPR